MYFSLSSPSPSPCYQCLPQNHPLFPQCRSSCPRFRQHVQISSLLRRSSKKSPKSPPKSSPPDRRIEMVIDLEDIPNRASASLQRFFRSSRKRFREFLSSGAEAVTDLQTLVTFDRKGRMVVACRRSSLEFFANLAILSFLAVFAVRFLAKLVQRSRLGNWDLVWRRDRSLAGKEVVVGRRFKRNSGFGASVNPLSRVKDLGRRSGERKVSKRETLPSWWPSLVAMPIGTAEKEFQREAGTLIQAIMDDRMGGKDVTEDDIFELRRLCKTSGVKVSIGAANVRDSLFRAAVDFILNSCRNATCQPNFFQINGEDPRHFVAGFADSIGLEHTRAAKIVCATVAARTRACFLQTWALEIQGKRAEALDELKKICSMHQIFPPEENSAEMEMVAHGLRRHLKLEHREHLLKLLEGVCGSEDQRIAAEALGLYTSGNTAVYRKS